jgi:catechol 2,3-dioxygenase-like lactoylglutathione lyase family enzyme
VLAALSRVVISVQDIERSLAFYRDALSLPAVVTRGFASVQAGNGIELLLHERASAPSDTAVAASFTVADLDGVCAQWARHGGEIVDQPERQTWGERMAVVRDADGHLVCLIDRDGSDR